MTSRSLPVRLSPRPVRTLRRRMARSGLAADLRANGPILVGCLLILAAAVLINVLLRDVALTPAGVIDLRPMR